MIKMRFFDDNTRSWRTPVTGGANIPALNDLLAPLGIAFGDKILNGEFSFNGEQSFYSSGTDIVKFPKGGYVHSFEFQDTSESSATQNVLQNPGGEQVESSILGLVETSGGRIAVYGDSNCLDSSHMVTNCYWLLKKILDFTNNNIKDPVLFSDSAKIKFPKHIGNKILPSRRNDVNFSAYSSVIGKELVCHRDSRFEVWGTKGYGIQLMGRNRKLPGYPTMPLENDLNDSSKESDKILQKKIGYFSREISRDNFGRNMDILSFFNHDENDIPFLAAAQWIVPAILAVICLLLLISWRQKRRRRRKGSLSSRSLNLV